MQTHLQFIVNYYQLILVLMPKFKFNHKNIERMQWWRPLYPRGDMPRVDISNKNVGLYLGVAILTALLIKRRTCRLNTTTGKNSSILKKKKSKTKQKWQIFPDKVLAGPSTACFHSTFTGLCFLVTYFDRWTREKNSFRTFLFHTHPPTHPPSPRPGARFTRCFFSRFLFVKKIEKPTV